MLRKAARMVVLIGLQILLVAWLVLVEQSPALAQCEEFPQKSSCIVCHNTSATPDLGEAWHGIHARKDCCTKCHGGNYSVMEVSLAHEGLTANPLEDIYTSCHSCHPDDYTERAAVFSAEMGVAIGSRETPTPACVVVAIDHPMLLMTDATGPSRAGIPAGILIFGLAFLVMLGMLLWFIYDHIRRTTVKSA